MASGAAPPVNTDPLPPNHNTGEILSMDETRLETYARLIVEKGLNPDPGQEVIITAGLDQPEFVRMVAEACYRRGVARVITDWRDMPLARLDQLWQSEEKLAAVDTWELARLQWRTEQLPAVLWLDSDDPDGMDGIDQGKRARAQMARFPKIKPFRDAMENRHQWCIAGVPGRKWAQKLFPELPVAEAQEKLWEAILAAARANGDPLANWDEHNRIIHQRAQKLNGYHLRTLKYHSANGTDFTIELIPEGEFLGGSETDLNGRVFNPNIPSEELFTTPMRGRAEGVLVATRPLSWQGSLIEDFSIRFENGRAVEVEAASGRDALEKMIAMDDGAACLGECALIGADSPINRSGLLFYNTLYDENASCHFALGRGFENCIRHYERYSRDELHAMGVNDSMIHVDFMVGTDDLEITGVSKTGEEVAVFRAGEWCF